MELIHCHTKIQRQGALFLLIIIQTAVLRYGVLFQENLPTIHSLK